MMQISKQNKESNQKFKEKLRASSSFEGDNIKQIIISERSLLWKL